MKPEPLGSGQDTGLFESPVTDLHRRLAMDKFIGFDIDYKNTVACITQEGWRDCYTKLKTEVGTLWQWLQTKNRIRSLLKSQGLKWPHRGGCWNGTNRAWMRQETERDGGPWREVLGDLLDTLELQERQLSPTIGCQD